MVNRLEDYVLDCWKEFFPEHEKPDRLSFILVSNLPPQLGVVTFLIIPDGSLEPVLTAKIPRYLGHNNNLKEKVECVRCLKKDLPHHLSGSLPEVISVTEIAGRLVILEQSMPMPTLGLELKRCRGSGSIFGKVDGLEFISDWLIDFFQATRKPATDQRLERLILPSLGGFEDRFSPTSLQKQWLDKIRTVLVQEKNIPHVGVRHSNLTPDYVSYNKQQLYIFNWENMEEKGLSLLDLFHFITSLALYEIRKVEEAKDRFQALILAQGNESGMVRKWINRVSNAMGIYEPCRNLLYLLYLIGRALNWTEFETTENYWPHLFSSYASYLDQTDPTA